MTSIAHDNPHHVPNRQDCGRFLVDVTGRFAPDDIEMQWLAQPRPSSDAIDSSIDEIWQQEMQRAGRDGRKLFDGRLCRLIACQPHDRRLTLVCGPVTFREFVGTNLMQSRLCYTHGPAVLADPIGVSAALLTNDRYLVLGRRAAGVAVNPRRIHPVGGMLEPPREGGVPDPFACILREIVEETGLEREDIGQSVCLGLIRDKQMLQPELPFHVPLKVGFDTLRRSVESAPDGMEHDELIPIRNDPSIVVTFLQANHDDMTPVAVATLLLHGLSAWGSGWLASARGSIPEGDTTAPMPRTTTNGRSAVGTVADPVILDGEFGLLHARPSVLIMETAVAIRVL